MEEKSLAWELLQDSKKANKRQFIVILVILVMWFVTIGYLVYTLNDIGTVEETTTQQVDQENESGNIIFIGSNGDISNGETKNKANKNDKN